MLQCQLYKAINLRPNSWHDRQAVFQERSCGEFSLIKEDGGRTRAIVGMTMAQFNMDGT